MSDVSTLNQDERIAALSAFQADPTLRLYSTKKTTPYAHEFIKVDGKVYVYPNASDRKGKAQHFKVKGYDKARFALSIEDENAPPVVIGIKSWQRPKLVSHKELFNNPKFYKTNEFKILKDNTGSPEAHYLAFLGLVGRFNDEKKSAPTSPTFDLWLKGLNAELNKFLEELKHDPQLSSEIKSKWRNDLSTALFHVPVLNNPKANLNERKATLEDINEAFQTVQDELIAHMDKDINKVALEKEQKKEQQKTIQNKAAGLKKDKIEINENIKKIIAECSGFINPIRARKANNPTSISPTDDLAMQCLVKLRTRLGDLKKELTDPQKTPQQLKPIKLEVYQLNEKIKEIRKVGELLKYGEKNLLAEGGEKSANQVAQAMAVLETYLENFAKSDNMGESIANDDLHYFEKMFNQVKADKPPSVILREVAKEFAAAQSEKAKDEQTYGVEETSQYWKEQKAINDKDVVTLEEQARAELRNPKKNNTQKQPKIKSSNKKSVSKSAANRERYLVDVMNRLSDFERHYKVTNLADNQQKALSAIKTFLINEHTASPGKSIKELNRDVTKMLDQFPESRKFSIIRAKQLSNENLTKPEKTELVRQRKVREEILTIKLDIKTLSTTAAPKKATQKYAQPSFFSQVATSVTNAFRKKATVTLSLPLENLKAAVAAKNPLLVTEKMSIDTDGTVLKDIKRTAKIVVINQLGQKTEYEFANLKDFNQADMNKLFNEIAPEEPMRSELEKYFHQGGFRDLGQDTIYNYNVENLNFVRGTQEPPNFTFICQKNGTILFKESFGIGGVIFQPDPNGPVGQSIKQPIEGVKGSVTCSSILSLNSTNQLQQTGGIIKLTSDNPSLTVHFEKMVKAAAAFPSKKAVKFPNPFANSTDIQKKLAAISKLFSKQARLLGRPEKSPDPIVVMISKIDKMLVMVNRLPKLPPNERQTHMASIVMELSEIKRLQGELVEVAAKSQELFKASIKDAKGKTHDYDMSGLYNMVQEVDKSLTKMIGSLPKNVREALVSYEPVTPPPPPLPVPTPPPGDPSFSREKNVEATRKAALKAVHHARLDQVKSPPIVAPGYEGQTLGIRKRELPKEEAQPTNQVSSRAKKPSSTK